MAKLSDEEIKKSRKVILSEIGEEELEEKKPAEKSGSFIDPADKWAEDKEEDRKDKEAAAASPKKSLSAEDELIGVNEVPDNRDEKKKVSAIAPEEVLRRKKAVAGEATDTVKKSLKKTKKKEAAKPEAAAKNIKEKKRAAEKKKMPAIAAAMPVQAKPATAALSASRGAAEDGKKNPVSPCSVCKTAAGCFLLIAAVALFLYLFFFSLLINSGVDNVFFRRIESVFTVPALITSAGAIGYYEYQDAKNGVMRNMPELDAASAGEKAKEELIYKKIFSNLAKRYGIGLGGDSAEIKNKLAAKIFFDECANKQGLEKIGNIKRMLAEGADFKASADIFADEYEISAAMLLSEAAAKFNLPESFWNSGEASGIIIADDGYCIIRPLEEKEGKAVFNRACVKAKGVDEYIMEKISNLRICSFAE